MGSQDHEAGASSSSPEGADRNLRIRGAPTPMALVDYGNHGNCGIGKSVVQILSTAWQKQHRYEQRSRAEARTLHKYRVLGYTGCVAQSSVHCRPGGRRLRRPAQFARERSSAAFSVQHDKKSPTAINTNTRKSHVNSQVYCQEIWPYSTLPPSPRRVQHDGHAPRKHRATGSCWCCWCCWCRWCRWCCWPGSRA
jgi:hypothetical protein